MNEEMCPVCGEEIGEDVQNVTVEDKQVRVCCDDCAQKVREHPDRYAATAIPM